MLTKQDFTGKGRPTSGEPEGNGAQGGCSTTGLMLSGFMAMVLVSRLSLTNYSDSLAKMDSSKDFRRLVRHMA